MVEIWNSKYPVGWKKWQATVVPALIIYLMIAILQPFGIAEIQNPSKQLVLLGYGIVTAFVMAFTHVLLPLLFPKYYQEKAWTVGKNLLRFVLSLLLITLSNWIYSYIVLGVSLDRYSFYRMLVYVFILATIPKVIFVLWNRNMLLSNNLSEANKLNHLLTQSQQKERTHEANATPSEMVPDQNRIMLTGGIRETLELNASDFLFAEAEGNYVNVHYVSEGREKVQMMRTTMNQMEESIISDGHIIRCHRAFFVNIDKVVSVEGNAQGLRLQLVITNNEIPVSRTFVNRIKSMLSGNL